ncbi:hypothetical protein GCM10009733_078480 [Nonomuraea maheshkhaliensis]|uniref:Uncharacterized protein n=1 Tax=Nonomuraea maheshkhaliensis TaxID=419590 RepID=A0ABN2GD95_9ACTN
MTMSPSPGEAALEGVAVQAGEQSSQGAGGQARFAGQAGAGAQVGVVPGDESGDLRRGGRAAEYVEQGQRRQGAEPVAASPAAARVGRRVQDLGQGGQIERLGGQVGDGDVLQVEGEHVDRG